MKFISALIGLLALAFAGYFSEPYLRDLVVSEAKPEKEVEEEPEVASGDPANPSPMPPTPPAETPAPAPVRTEIPDWVYSLVPAQLPEKVTLRVTARIPMEGSPEPMALPVGAKVTPVRVEGEQLVISPFAGPIEGKVAILETDLLDILGDTPPPAFGDPSMAENTTGGETPENGSTEMPAETPATTPETAETPETPATPTAEPLDADGIVAAMQESVKSGGVNEFGFDQVLEWTAGEDEERDGASYQTGKVTYKAETIFGVKNIQAQALILNGKVAKWIWPTSGMEIK